MAVACLLPTPAQAVPRTWENTGTDFTAGGNWIGGVAPANNITDDIGVFAAATPVNNPQLPFFAFTRSINGLSFASGTGAWTFTAVGFLDKTLILGSSGIVNNSTSTQTFTGGLLTLQLGANAAFNGDAGALNFDASMNGINISNFNLTLTGSVGGTIGTVVSGTGNLIKTGSGTWTLSGANTYSGTTSIGTAGGASGGRLVLGANNVLPDTAVNVFAGTLDVNTRTETIGALSLGGGASGTTAQVIIGTGGVLTLGGTVTYDAANNPNGAVISGAGTLALGADRTFNVADSTAAAEDLAILTSISGANALTKTGDGALLLSGSNTHSGTNNLNQGTVRVGSNANLGTGAITFNGGTLNTTSNMTITAARTFTIGASGGTVDVNTGTALTYNGVIAGTGSLIKEGAGTLQTGGTGSNSWSGPLAVNAGTFEITKQGAVSAIGDAAAVNVATGATLRLNGNAGYTQETIGSLAGGGTVVNSGAAAVNFIITGSSNTTFSGVITDTTNNLNILKTGTSTLTLSGSNSYDGTTLISNGVIIAANNTALGTSSNGTTVVSGAGLALQGGITISNESLSIAGTGVGGNGALRNLSGTNTWTGAITLTNTTEFQSDAGRLNIAGNIAPGAFRLTVDGPGATGISGAVGPGAGGITKTGTGTLFLTGSNTYSGGTLISGGTLQVGEGGTTGSLSPASNITNNATFAFNRSDNIAQGTGFSSNGISGTGALVKNGAGTLTLNANNTYSGTTTVNSGTLLLNSAGGNAVTGSSITVNSGATLALGADNQIGNTTGLILNGGTFRVGTASTGFSDTLGTLTLTANSTIDLGAFTGVHSITFANSSAIAWTPGAVLTISNWQGLVLDPGDAGRIFFGTNGLTSTQLAQVVWAPQGFVGATLLGAGGELTPIPEAQVVWAAAALVLAVGWKERRRLRQMFRR